jgi:peptide/nickel transport system substrate-binding protein
VLVRNPNWDPSTDPVRTALPDGVDLALQLDPNEIDNQLLEGILDIDIGQAGVEQAAQAKRTTPTSRLPAACDTS